ncbi:hypothetical protein [Hymenobacter bucti]|uniref:Uncharacterized protein n=1 Tax=Hymenobacter bucti TaxID=1844114 RepID=A0ABW4QWU9_9BACT
MRKPLWLAPALLLASCRSEQLVFQTPPATSVPVAATAPRVLADTTLTATVAAARPSETAATAAPLAAPASHSLVPLPAEPRPPRKAQLRLPALSNVFITKPLAKQLAHRLRQRRSTEGTAESGLGGIGLFVIGVVLALLAGLGALVNVIFSVGFFTGVGCAAAGLVVLFLLYSLFSGGKKKK